MKAANRVVKEIGLYGIDVPEEYGGQNMGMLAKAVVIEELKYSIVPFILPPDSPNLWMLKETCRGDQIDKYLIPYANGEKKSAIAITEPSAGSDPANMQMRADFKNGKYLVWDVRGRVQIVITRLAGPDAVLNGVFFD